MKKPKILLYDWEDLTGFEELDDEGLEVLRVVLLTIVANQMLDDLRLLQMFLQGNRERLLAHPTSDLCAAVYRLLEGEDKRYLAAQRAFDMSDTETVSLKQLLDLIEAAFLASQRPVPIVSGTSPRIML